MKTMLTTTHPHLAAQWHPTLSSNLTPEMVTAGSGKKVWWLGECSHEWDAIVADRSGKRLGCPYCSGHRVLVGFNDLATINPEIVKFWHPTKNGDLTPEMVTVGSKNYAWWVCKIGHNVYATIHAFNKTRSCPICDNREVLPNFNDLAFLSPILAAEWHPTLNGTLTPQMVTTGNSKKVWWLCSEGHEWQATIYSRKKNKCPVCGGQKVWTGKTDLATLRPDLASIWHPTKNGALTPPPNKSLHFRS